MNEMKHTPGPWIAFHDDGVVSAYERTGDHTSRIVTISGGSSIANARLIAAAPDMLEALEDARKWLNGQPDRSNCKAHSLFALIENIDAALSLATAS